MWIYIVRHGKSLDHDADRRQTPDSILGKTGKKQAKLVAKRFKEKDHKIDFIMTSKWPRAYETAKNIATVLKQKVEIVEGIHEKEQQASTYGIDINSKEFESYIKAVKKYGKNLDWKYKNGGESLRDVIERAAKFQKHLLKEHLGQNIVVVTHGNFIRCFIAYAILGKNYNDETFYKLFDAIHQENTGISLLGYDEENKEWNIVYLNDHSHLDALK